MIKKILSMFLALAMIFGFTACSYEDLLELRTVQNFISTINGEDITGKFGEATVKIGVLEPQSGKYYYEGLDELRGIRLANALFPSVGDVQVELVYADNQSDAASAETAARYLVDEGCKIVIGSYSNVLTMAAMDVFTKNQVVCICPSATNPLITTTSDYMFRVSVVDSFQGNSAAKYVIEYLPKIIHPSVMDNPETEEDETVEGGQPVKCVILKRADDERASALIERFQGKMEQIFGEDGYARVIEYPANTEDMDYYFDRIKNAEAEVVFFPSNAIEAEKVIWKAKNAGYDFQWIGNGDWAGIQAAASDAGRLNQDHLEGVSFVAAFDKKKAATEMTTLFLSAAQAYYGEDEPNDRMALAFDAYILAVKGLEDANLGSSDDIRKAIDKFTEVNGATGSFTYLGGGGDPVKEVIIEKIVNGRLKVDYTATPVWN